MVYIRETITKQDRLARKIMGGIANEIKAVTKELSYDDRTKNGLNYDNLATIIDFGICEGIYSPSYKLKNWLTTTKELFDGKLPPQNILVAIYKEFQKYPQGTIRGYN